MNNLQANEVQKYPVPEIGTAPVPEMGALKHTVFKQTSEKQTVTTAAPEEPTGQDASPKKNDVVVTLSSLGMTEKVAQRLTSHFSRERIEEKIQFLEFLKQTQPEKAKNPCGWLRKAIEEDYSQPDGFKTKAELEAEESQRQHEVIQTEQTWKIVQEDTELKLRLHKLKEQAQTEALKQRYGTTDNDLKIWSEVLTDLKQQTPNATFNGFLAKTVLLSTNDNQALIGVANGFAKEWLEVQMSQKIKRTLKSLYRLKISEVKFVAICDQPTDADYS